MGNCLAFFFRPDAYKHVQDTKRVNHLYHKLNYETLQLSELGTQNHHLIAAYNEQLTLAEREYNALLAYPASEGRTEPTPLEVSRLQCLWVYINIQKNALRDATDHSTSNLALQGRIMVARSSIARDESDANIVRVSKQLQKLLPEADVSRHRDKDKLDVAEEMAMMSHESEAMPGRERLHEVIQANMPSHEDFVRMFKPNVAVVIDDEVTIRQQSSPPEETKKTAPVPTALEVLA